MSSKGILRVYCSTALGLAGHELTALQRVREKQRERDEICERERDTSRT